MLPCRPEEAPRCCGVCCCRCPAASRIRHLVETAPVSRSRGGPVRARGRARRRPSPRPATWCRQGLLASLDRLGEDTVDAAPGDGHPRRLPHAARAARRRRPDRRRRGVGQAVRGRPGAARRRREGRARQRARDLRGGHATPAPRSPSTWRTTPPPTRRCGILRELRSDFPEHRRGAAGLPAPHRGRLPGPARTPGRGSGCARAPTRSRSRWRSRARRRRQVLRPLPQGADGRRRLPDGRHPRPAAGRHRRGPGPPQRAGRKDSYEFQMLYGIRPHEQAPAGRRRASGCGSTCRTATSGTATSCAGWPSDPPTSRSSYARWPPRARRDCRWRRLRDGSPCSAPARWARRCCPACCAPARAADDLRRHRAPARAGGDAARSATASTWSAPPRRPRRADTLILTVKPQDMGALLDELAPHVPAGPAGRVRRRPASPTAFLEAPARRRHAGGAGHVQHAGARRRGDERDLGRRARDRGAPARAPRRSSRRSAGPSGCPSRSRTR